MGVLATCNDTSNVITVLTLPTRPVLENVFDRWSTMSSSATITLQEAKRYVNQHQQLYSTICTDYHVSEQSTSCRLIILTNFSVTSSSGLHLSILHQWFDCEFASLTLRVNGLTGEPNDMRRSDLD